MAWGNVGHDEEAGNGMPPNLMGGVLGNAHAERAPLSDMTHEDMSGAHVVKSADDDEAGEEEEEENSPVQQVALTVPITDDPTLPVWTFRMWFLGILCCALLAFLNQFFYYRSQPLFVSAIAAQIAVLPLGKFMAAVLPTGFLNPGPFNMKEHVLITIFANAGSSFGSGNAYAVDILTLTKAYYHRHLDFAAAALVITTTQVLGYGWAGIMKKFLVDPAHMWWPDNLVSVSLFRTLHEPEPKKGLSRFTFFLIFSVLSFLYYVVPGYLFNVVTSVSWICWIWPNSVTAQQVGSGLYGLGVGAVGFDWSTIESYLGSPLATPWFAIVNIYVGFLLVMYVLIPLGYWTNLYNAKSFPIFDSGLYLADGTPYTVSDVVDGTGIALNITAYEENGPIQLPTSFALVYAVSFASLTALVTHILLWNGQEIYERTRDSVEGKLDVHTRIMRQNYRDIPTWWFLLLGGLSLGLAIFTVEYWKSSLQLPWWGVVFGAALAFVFTLPIGIIAATTNQVPGLNIITEFIMGYILPGKPIAVICFKVYGYISMAQAVAFLSDFKLGHYMKIPPRSMFLVQVVGTILAGMVNLAFAWYQLNDIQYICEPNLLPPNSPWTCPSSKVFYNASIIWGLIGPKRVFGTDGQYSAMVWGFLIGAVAPIPFWAIARAFPERKWLRLINMPVFIGGTGILLPASPVNYHSWFICGFIFNFWAYYYRTKWWQRYNYVLSAALDTGVAFMGVLLFFALQQPGYDVSWWGNQVDNCPYAACPTQPGLDIGSAAFSATDYYTQLCPVS
eukprot:TRINITY_DN5404_c0_g1_i1.p1 TRINITY_DN5404_c0_g1~~TRINITY_DN5404_c0_g1_i1.p1  ORF type:complete len:785 (+),score=97.94 TRINITY_DN5404_c0_g1_i1:548-2902(+)